MAARRSGSGAQQRTRRGENPGGDSSRRGARSARRLPSSAAQVRRGGAGRRCLPWARCGASSELGRAVSAAACSSRAVWLLSARSVCRNAAAAQSVRATRRAALGSQARCGAWCFVCALRRLTLVIAVCRNVLYRPEDPGALDVEDGVPPPRAAPPLLRRVVLSCLLLASVFRRCE